MIKNRLFLLTVTLVFIFGFLVRLYKINIPLADHHSWRQADTAAVARNFVKDKFNFLKPQIDNFIPLHPGKENTERLFMVEPPIYNTLVAVVYRMFGVKIDYARYISIFFYLLSALFLYKVVSLVNDRFIALFVIIFYLFLPFGIFYSRTVMPEPLILTLITGSYFFCLYWLKNKYWYDWLLFVLFTALALTQKAFPVFCLAPLGYLLFKNFGFKIIKNKTILIAVLLVIIPLFLWRWWVGHYPDGIPANLWLFNQNNIRFKGAFFYWLFARRIAELMLGWWGLPLFVFGLLAKPDKKYGWLFHWWLAGLIAFCFVFAAGNITHDYYQIPWLPVLAYFAGLGTVSIIRNNMFSWIKYPVIISTILFTLAFSWYQIRDFYNIQGGVDLAGSAIDRLTPRDALVITGDTNDASLLYNTNRHGWSVGYASPYPNSQAVIEDLVRKGATYYVSTKFDTDSDFGKYMVAKYPIIEETNQYVVFKLVVNNL